MEPLPRNGPQSCPRCEKTIPVTVYWDVENCSVPSEMKGFQVVSAIRSYTKSIQGGIFILKNISLFGNLNLLKQELRTELQQCGVLLHDVSSGKPSAADMALMVEFLKLACDCPPPHKIVLISGDRDFSTVLNVLVFRGYDITLIHTPNTSTILKSAANSTIEWRKFLSQEENLEGETETNDKKTWKLLEVVLLWLKKEYFKPTEQTIHNGCKREFKKRNEKFTPSMWNDVLNIIEKNPNSFVTFGQGPQRLIFFTSDIFDGVDPSEPPKKPFADSVWNDLLKFLGEIHPTSKLGRFGFAEFLKDKGPNSIKTMPLAKITQLVQIATNQRYLQFDKNVLHTVDLNNVGKEELPSKGQQEEEKLKTCIREVMRQHNNRIQIGGLSAIIEKKGLMSFVKLKGGLKKYLQSLDLYDLQHDSHNGLWIINKDPLEVIQSYIKENKSVHIGTLSGHIQQMGLGTKLKSMGGLKNFILSTNQFDFQTMNGGTWIRLRTSSPSSQQQGQEEEGQEEGEEEGGYQNKKKNGMIFHLSESNSIQMMREEMDKEMDGEPFTLYEFGENGNCGDISNTSSILDFHGRIPIEMLDGIEEEGGKERYFDDDEEEEEDDDEDDEEMTRSLTLSLLKDLIQ